MKPSGGRGWRFALICRYRHAEYEASTSHEGPTHLNLDVLQKRLRAQSSSACQMEILHASHASKLCDFPAWLPNIQQCEHNFSIFQPHPETTNTEPFFYFQMWWELKSFDISISINCAGNIQRRAVWSQKNRITDMAVWNYKEIMHMRHQTDIFWLHHRKTNLMNEEIPWGGVALSAWIHLNSP